ncbi:hypothetical protein [Streptomyces sp. NPDC055056]
MTALFVVVDPFDSTSQPAYAVTPQPLRYESGSRAADDVLEEIAQRIESLPDERPSSWSSEHFVLDDWSLSTRINGTQITSAVIPEHRDIWEKADGSSRWTSRTLQPQFTTAEQRQTWKRAGAVGDKPTTRSGETDPTKVSAVEPPSTPDGMKRWLAQGHDVLTPGLAFEVVPERYRDHVFSPAQRAAIMRVLEGVDGLTYEGLVKDRTGRTGQAFSLTSDAAGLPTKRTLVVQESTGNLLAQEEELTTNAGQLHVKPPAVIGYTTFLTAERVA